MHATRHDGWEEQGVELCEYVDRLGAPLRAVLLACTTSGVPAAVYERCNDVLVAIADSWRDMGGINFRCDKDEAVVDCELNLSGIARTLVFYADEEDEEDDDDGRDDSKLSRHDAVAMAWCTLLRATSSSGAPVEEVLLRIVADADEFGYVPMAELAQVAPPLESEAGWFTQAGAARLRRRRVG